MKGLYIHIPFCVSKCCYCDFYSLPFDESLADRYLSSILERLNQVDETFDTAYFGGGTPSVFGAERIAAILDNVDVGSGAEITMECNPADASTDLFESVKHAGVNRISLGMQSAVEQELKFLTRRHSVADIKDAIRSAKTAGIYNISLDVMLGLYGQTADSLQQTLDFCINSDITHVSAYMLHVEENTPLAKFDTTKLPDDDLQSQFYLQTATVLEKNGFIQYEISNFAKQGFESKHNLIYWNCDPYLGLGPAAHSFWDGKRFYYPRDIHSFIDGAKPVQDGTGGTFEEYLMLRLRLKDGFVFEDAAKRGFCLTEKQMSICKQLEKQKLLIADDKHISLTKDGFLVQNQIISRLI